MPEPVVLHYLCINPDPMAAQQLRMVFAQAAQQGRDPDGDPGWGPGARPDANWRDGLGRTGAHQAGIAGCGENLQVLLDNGLDTEIKEHANGCTALHLTMGGDFMDATLRLLTGGANLEATDHKGLTPIDYAVRNEATNALTTAAQHLAAQGTKLNDPAQQEILDSAVPAPAAAAPHQLPAGPGPAPEPEAGM